jgi:hypothetical protein
MRRTLPHSPTYSPGLNLATALPWNVAGPWTVSREALPLLLPTTTTPAPTPAGALLPTTLNAPPTLQLLEMHIHMPPAMKVKALARVLFSMVRSEAKVCTEALAPTVWVDTPISLEVAELPLLWRMTTGAAKVALPRLCERASVEQLPDRYSKLTGPRAVKVALYMYMPAVRPVLEQVLLVMVVLPSKTTAVPVAALMAGTGRLLLTKVLLCSQALPPATDTRLRPARRLVQVTLTASRRPLICTPAPAGNAAQGGAEAVCVMGL